MTVVNATTVKEALEALSEHPKARFIQGGTDMMVEVNFGRHAVADVISLRRVDELRQWHRTSDSTVFIGAGLPYRQMEHGELATIFPALAEAARTVGSPQIRAAGTLGGNLGTCSPAGDGLPVLAALDAVIHLESLDGSRTLPFVDFMTGVKRNAARADELITGVTLPIVTGYQGYSKVGVRNAMVIAIASACLVHDRINGEVRLALGAVAPTIVRCSDAERFIADRLASGDRIDGAMISDFAQLAVGSARPIDDHRSTADYRRHAVRVMAKRLAWRAFNVEQ